MISLETGSIVWAELGEGVGREQGGRRPVVVISSADHRALVPDLVAVVPATGVDRGWPNHVEEFVDAVLEDDVGDVVPALCEHRLEEGGDIRLR